MRVLHVPSQTPVVRLAGVEVRRPRRDDEAVLEHAGRREVRVLEAAVLNQLGVEAAVTGVADLFEEDAVQRRRDRRARRCEITVMDPAAVGVLSGGTKW
jgi:hypothetical protein